MSRVSLVDVTITDICWTNGFTCTNNEPLHITASDVSKVDSVATFLRTRQTVQATDLAPTTKHTCHTVKVNEIMNTRSVPLNQGQTLSPLS